MFEGVIWDFDGTLFNTYPGMVKAFHRTLQGYGIEEMEDNIHRQMKVSVSYAINYFKENYGLIDDAFKERYDINEKELHEDLMQPYPFSMEICCGFKKNGGRNFIFTHRDDSTVRYLKYHKMLEFFEDVVTKQYGFKKPGPEGFNYIAEKYGISKDNLLVVGDRDIDILGAQNAGMKACLFSPDKMPFSSKPDYIISSLDELKNILTI